jgi:hypothetical protein
MIELKLNGKTFDLPKTGLTISGEENNSLLLDEEEGTFSLPFQLPITPNNSALLGSPEVISNRTKFGKKYTGLTVYLAGYLWKSGTLNLRDVTGGMYNLNFTAGVSSFASNIVNKKLSELNLGGDRVMVPPAPTVLDLPAEIANHMLSLVNSDSSTSDYVFFPVKNDDFYANPDEYHGYVNNWDGTNFLTNFYEFNNSHTKDYPIVPFAYFLYVFKKCFEQSNLSVVGDFIIDPDIKRLVIYNNFSLDAIVRAATFPTNTYVNVWGRVINLKNHVPDMTVTDFIKAIKGYFRLGYFFNDSNRTVKIVSLQSILDSYQYEDWTAYAEPKPDLTSNDQDGFVFSLLKDDNDALYTTLIKDLSGYTVLSSVEKVADLPSAGNGPNQARLVRTLNKYYATNDDGSGGYYWEEYSENLTDLTIGNGKTKVEINCGTVATYYSTSGVRWLVPWVNAPGSSSQDDEGITSFPLRLMFYRGMQAGIKADNSAMTYPMGTPYKWDYNGSSIGNYSLSLDQDSGVYNQFHARWLDFVDKATLVKMTINFDLATFLKLDLSTKKRINNDTYIVSKVSYNISTSGIKKATVELLRV